MKICTKCGKKNKEKQIFCNYCGNILEDEAVIKDGYANEIYQSQKMGRITILPDEDLTLDEKLTKKAKISIILVAALIIFVIVVAIVQARSFFVAPMKLEARFQNDITSNNTSDLASILYCSDARLIIDSKNIKPLISYFKSHPLYYDEVIRNLNKDVLNPKTINNLSSQESSILTLTNIGKKFFIFPSYKIVLKPSFVDITTKVKGVTFAIDNTLIGKSDTNKSAKQFGPYIPGDYLIWANYKDQYVTLSQSYPLDLIVTNNGITKLSVFNDLNYLNITPNYVDAVNSQLSDLLGNYTASFTQAVNTNNVSLIAVYVTTGSELYKTQQLYIPTKYKAGVHENIISAKITNYNISNDNKSGSITTLESYNITNKYGISFNRVFKYIYKFQYDVTTHSYQFTNLDLSNQ